MIFKRCLIGLQKGVSKGLKEHLLQAKRALIESRFGVFIKSMNEKSDKGGLVIRSESSQYIDWDKENEFGMIAELIFIKVYFRKYKSSDSLT